MHNNIKMEQIETLRHSARLVVRELGLLKEAYFDIGVTLAERHLLVEVASSLYPDVGYIAKQLLLDKSTVSRLIAKAVKKGLIVCIVDENDRRRRCLQLTEQGRKTLSAIEPLAQGQVRDALVTMHEKEREVVMRGLSLFAKGLAKARLRKEFVVEPIARANNVALTDLIISALEEYDCNKPGFASDDTELQTMYEAYQKKRHAYFVIKRKNKIVGGAGIAPLQGEKLDVCELRKMYLAKEIRGFGLGELLLEVCLTEAKRQGYHECYLETDTKMKEAQAFYLRNGFERITKRKGNTGHFGCDVFFEKKL